MARKTVLAGIVLAVFGGIVWAWQGEVAPRSAPSQQKPGEAMAAVHVPELSDQEREGEALFRSACASCHGVNADGARGAGPPLVHKIYHPGHHADGAFYLAVANGVRAHHWTFGDMAPVSGLDRDQVRQIIIYVRALQRANGIFN